MSESKMSVFYQILGNVLNDTFKRDGKYSSTLITMFVFSASTLLYGWVDFILHGFNGEVFFAFVGLASGIKIADAFSKKVKPSI
jgi:hypothetical protein